MKFYETSYLCLTDPNTVPKKSQAKSEMVGGACNTLMDMLRGKRGNAGRRVKRDSLFLEIPCT